MKKLVALILAFMMVIGAMPTIEAEEAPTVITVGTMMDADWTNYELFQKVKKELNIEIEFTKYDGDSLAVMLADGSLPDIMNARLEYLDSVLKSGYAFNFEPYIDEYMPAMNNPLYASTNDLLQMLYPSEDNAIYIMCPAVGISEQNGGTTQKRGYVVRWDYYKELGCPPIESDEDYINVLTEMCRNHPVDEYGNTMWAWGVNKSLRDMGGYRASFRNDVAVNLWSTPYLYKASTITNELVNNYTDTEKGTYWLDMHFQNQLYRNGIYNMDVFIMEDDEFDALTCEGRFMGVHYVENAFYRTEMKKNPETLSAYVVVPSSNAWLYADCNLMLGNAPAYYSFINAKSEHKELAMKLMNYMYEPDFIREWYSGPQGEAWEYIDGIPTMKDEYLEKIANYDSDFVETRGYARMSGYIGGYMETAQHPDGYPLDLRQSRENMIATQVYWQKDFAAYYGEELWMDALYKNMKHNEYDASETISAAMTDIPTDIKRKLELCNDVMETAMPELIAAETDEEFEAIQEQVLLELQEIGEPECWEWFSTTWNEARAKVMPIFEESCVANGLR